jgi:hypothetical protein
LKLATLDCSSGQGTKLGSAPISSLCLLPALPGPGPGPEIGGEGGQGHGHGHGQEGAARLRLLAGMGNGSFVVVLVGAAQGGRLADERHRR